MSLFNLQINLKVPSGSVDGTTIKIPPLRGILKVKVGAMKHLEGSHYKTLTKTAKGIE